MSKYLGSVLKKLRALGLPLPRFRNKGNNPPGQHGAKRKRRKSSYGLKLQEKQKVLYSYGSESRLDNLVFRSGLLNTIGFAREWVSHGHFLVDGKKINIPSCKIEPGQVISLKKEKMKENKLIKDNLEKNLKVPPYLAFDKQKLIITYLRYPMREELSKDIDTSLIVE
ncbi:7334_t:CDS:2 [Funneliformis geosporum]|uniref:7334_t:CDS:1 n=1 Tax=Funneliformis geosporum TaxID=1117311 RepID=A0A9W4T5Y6_9GLOM|nr:7334_t:CDS:2 [Funneliformis geosporum]